MTVNMTGLVIMASGEDDNKTSLSPWPPLGSAHREEVSLTGKSSQQCVCYPNTPWQMVFDHIFAEDKKTYFHQIQPNKLIVIDIVFF